MTIDYYRDIWPQVVALIYDKWHTCEMRYDDDAAQWIEMSRAEALAYRGDTMTKKPANR